MWEISISCWLVSENPSKNWQGIPLTVDEPWTHSYEPESKQHSSVWMFDNQPNSNKVVWSSRTSKRMIACFFGVPLEDRRTVNFEWYTTISWPTIFDEIRKNNKTRKTTEYLKKKNIE